MYPNCSCSVEPYYKQSRTHEILHIKCPIIGLIRFQINNVQRRLAENNECYQRRKKWSFIIWKNRWAILSTFLMLILMTSLFIYGTMVGAGLCSTNNLGSSYNSPCPKTFAFLPITRTPKASRLTF